MLQLKVTRVGTHDLPVPRPASPGAAALDVRLREAVTLYPGEELRAGTGFAYEPPPGFALFLLPRSGLGSDHGIVLGNLVGLIDPDYRGELLASLWYRRSEGPPITLERGERVAQITCLAYASPLDVLEVEALSSTARGDGAFGSSGRT